MALPQFRLFIEAVSMAMPEGRYNADVMPTINNPVRMAGRLRVNPMQANARPVATAENTMVFLCNSLEETKPEHKSEIKYPDADIRKNDPA